MKLCEFTIVINSHNFIHSRWLYSQSEASLHGHEIQGDSLPRDTKQLSIKIMLLR
jgi:hypothetical protein